MKTDANKLVTDTHANHDQMKINDEHIDSARADLTAAQQLLIKEKTNNKNLYDRLSKLEEEYEFIRNRTAEHNEDLNRTFHDEQDKIILLTGDIDEILRR
jgi:uncharacterized protein (DUF3084 family)